MMVTSITLLHPYSPLNPFLTPCRGHTQASGESDSPTLSEAVASENCVQRSAYHKPLSNYPHCSGF